MALSARLAGSKITASVAVAGRESYTSRAKQSQNSEFRIQEENVKRMIGFCCCALLAFSTVSAAQTKMSPAGHWEGGIAVPRWS